jgi:hypothetical protein
MKNTFVLFGTIITYGFLTSCAADLKDSIKGQWISHETILMAEPGKKIDTLRIVNFFDDGTYLAIGKGKEFRGTWTVTNKKAANSKCDLLTVTVDSHSIVYEILQVEEYELVLAESTNGQGKIGAGSRIPFKRVRM